jgi:hypothetical protein
MLIWEDDIHEEAYDDEILQVREFLRLKERTKVSKGVSFAIYKISPVFR